MNLIKKYFDTPRMPLSFYYTPYFAVFVVNFLIMIGTGTPVLNWIFTIILFVLGTYTYAWLTDYMLFTSTNGFIRYFFMRSMIFRRDFGTIVKHTHAANKESRVYEWDGKRLEENHLVYVKRTFLGIVINVVVKFILAFIFIPVFYISILTHPLIIKKFRAKFAELETHENGQQY